MGDMEIKDTCEPLTEAKLRKAIGIAAKKHAQEFFTPDENGAIFEFDGGGKWKVLSELTTENFIATFNEFKAMSDDVIRLAKQNGNQAAFEYISTEQSIILVRGCIEKLPNGVLTEKVSFSWGENKGRTDVTINSQGVAYPSMEYGFEFSEEYAPQTIQMDESRVFLARVSCLKTPSGESILKLYNDGDTIDNGSIGLTFQDSTGKIHALGCVGLYRNYSIVNLLPTQYESIFKRKGTLITAGAVAQARKNTTINLPNTEQKRLIPERGNHENTYRLTYPHKR